MYLVQPKGIVVTECNQNMAVFRIVRAQQVTQHHTMQVHTIGTHRPTQSHTVGLTQK